MLFRTESLGCTCWALATPGVEVEAGRRGDVVDIVLDVEETVVLGLNVTVLCDLGEFGGLRMVFVGGGNSGDLSVDAEAIALGGRP